MRKNDNTFPGNIRQHGPSRSVVITPDNRSQIPVFADTDRSHVIQRVWGLKILAQIVSSFAIMLKNGIPVEEEPRSSLDRLTGKNSDNLRLKRDNLNLSDGHRKLNLLSVPLESRYDPDRGKQTRQQY